METARLSAPDLHLTRAFEARTRTGGPPLNRRISKILITNAVALNGGDAAILQSTIAILRERFGEGVRFEVYDMAAAASGRYYPQINIKQDIYSHVRDWAGARIRPAAAALFLLAAAWLRHVPLIGKTMHGLLPPGLRRTLADYDEADIVVSSGGTYLVPHYSLAGKLLDFLVTEALGKPLVLFTQSLGPFPPVRERVLLRHALRKAMLILVRDERSRRHLAELGVASDRVRICADAAFALAPAGLRGRSFPPAHRPWNIAISVRDWPHFKDSASDTGMERYFASVARLAADLIGQHGAMVTFISTCQGAPEYWTDDARTADEIVKRLPSAIRPHALVDRHFRRPVEMIARLKEFDLTIATRMHAAILSLCAGTPVLPISYEFKTTELFRRFGLGDAVIEIEHIDPGRVLDAFDKACVFWTEHSGDAWAIVREHRKSAFEAGDLVQHMLDRDLPQATY